MTIDIRVRVWSGKDPFAAALESSPTSANADQAGIDPSPAGLARSGQVLQAAVLTGWRIDRLGVQVATENIARWVNDAPAHRVGFAGIDPSADSALDDIDIALDLGMVGLTVAPADCAVRPTDDRFLMVAQRAAQRGMPILVANPCLTAPQSVLEFARPLLLDEACRALPTLSLVLGDLGGGFTEEAYALCAKHPRVFAELSGVITKPWHLYTTMLAAFERGVTDKLLFASGFPNETPERAIERMYTVNSVRNGTHLPGIPRETVRGIVERDSLRLLGIEHVAPMKKPAAPASPPKSAAPDQSSRSSAH
jgi:predicted TIM-barrel fold metal-dependent hydrolase